MYKLYYDTMPGNKLLLEELGSHIKSYKKNHWRSTGTLHSIMSVLGINYKWTNDLKDPEAIVIIEIDSSIEHDDVFKIAGIASKKFNKSIIASATEPPMTETISLAPSIKKLYPNVLLTFAGNPELNFKSSNLIFYPYYLVSPCTFDITTVPQNHVNCNNMMSGKPYILSNLSKEWTQTKYHTHYTIRNYLKNNKNIQKNNNSGALLSYRPLSLLEPDRKNIEKEGLKTLKNRIAHEGERERSGLFKKLYPAEHYANHADPDYPYHYPLMQLEQDLMTNHLINQTGGGSSVLSHPEQVYLNSHVSFVTEIDQPEPANNFISEALGFSKDNPNPLTLLDERLDKPPNVIFNHFISEKTVQPIINKHIFIVGNSDLSCGQYNTAFIRDYLGFQIFEEIFDYSKIETGDSSLTTYRIVEQLNTFEEEMIFDNAKVLSEKLYYNQDLIANPNSELRKKLKKWLTEDLLNKFLELEP